MQFFSFRVIGKRIKALLFMLKDKSVRWTKKALVIFGIIYLFLPIDLVPPVVPVLGFLDDIFLWGLILYYLKDELDTYWLGEKSTDYSGHFKDTYSDVSYTVVDESDEEEKNE